MNRPADARSIDATVDIDVVEAFATSIAPTFSELCSTEIAVSEPFLLDRAWTCDVRACLPLRREPPGKLELAFPRPVLEGLVVRYLGDASSPTPELLDDAAGEFANVIAGQAKTMLKGSPAHFLLSMPIISRPPDRIDEPTGARITWYCSCDLGTFGVQVLIQQD